MGKHIRAMDHDEMDDMRKILQAVYFMAIITLMSGINAIENLDKEDQIEPQDYLDR